jgi:hypothetical protein
MSLPICIEFILGDPTHSRFEHTLNNSLALIILTSIWRYYQFPAETVMVHLFIWRAFCFTSWPYPHPILVLVQYSIYLLCTRLGPILSTIDSKIWAIVRESEDIAGLKEHDRVDKLETAYKLEEHRRVSSRASPSVKRPLGEEQRRVPEPAPEPEHDNDETPEQETQRLATEMAKTVAVTQICPSCKVRVLKIDDACDHMHCKSSP